MKRAARRVVGMLVFGALISGCQPFKLERTIEMPTKNVHRIDIDAPGREQHIHLTADSGGVPINVYIVLEDNAEALFATLQNDTKVDTSTVLASQEQTTNADLQATIPGKKGFAIMLAHPSKNTTVRLKIVGR